MDGDNNLMLNALRSMNLGDILKRSAELSHQTKAVTSSAGVETPLSILSDVRKGVSEMTTELNSLNSKFDTLINIVAEQRNEQRLLLTRVLESPQGRVADDSSQMTSEFGSRSFNTTLGSTTTYYYGQWAVKTAPALLGCVMYHVDCLIANTNASLEYTDVSYMEPKVWCSLITMFSQSIVNAKQSMRLPKPSESDFKRAAEVVCSKFPGQSVQCGATQIRALVGLCPEIMSTAQLIIDYCMKYKGVLSHQRTKRLAGIAYPFVDGNEDLVSNPNAASYRPAPDSIHQKYTQLKLNQKKNYVKFLSEGVSPPVALRRAGE